MRALTHLRHRTKITIVLYNDSVKKTINVLEHLATLQDYYAQHWVLPSYTRLMSLLGFASKSGIKKVACWAARSALLLKS